MRWVMCEFHFRFKYNCKPRISRRPEAQRRVRPWSNAEALAPDHRGLGFLVARLLGIKHVWCHLSFATSVQPLENIAKHFLCACETSQSVSQTSWSVSRQPLKKAEAAELLCLSENPCTATRPHTHTLCRRASQRIFLLRLRGERIQFEQTAPLNHTLTLRRGWNFS